ncbi:hypothetical protein ROJ8625_02008 [Roseivivax jejudonensis]|uniref:Uncharacterized protein n=1 Tax=Roseivivax jejudonensis TaxID=1529041 RepID=A0A1X6Z658_9RHOB|nr:hypothetical protein [Roseivivax jejudonensis]SLN41761.1 hypothetical protein ROJ8625_02008 [Roseivivax jejudonensis]
MTPSTDSLAYLRLHAAGTHMETGIDFLFAQDHGARVNAVQRSVDFACNRLIRHRDLKQADSENSLSVQVCDMLTSSGIKATHDAAVGGHCDILVEGKDDFLWLAEAKKHNDYSWLDKGFQQLSTRYSTGVPGQDHGEVLIYCKVKDAKAMLNKWREELVVRNPEVNTSDGPCTDLLFFLSNHKHESSGLDFKVRHKVVSLHWEPKDN